MQGTFVGANLGSITWVSRAPGYAIQLPSLLAGIDFGLWSQVVGDTQGSLVPGQSAFSAFLEFKPLSNWGASDRRLIRFGNGGDILLRGGSTFGIEFYLIDFFGASVNRFATMSPDLVIGGWHSIAGTYDGSGNSSGLKLYLDATEIGLATSNGNMGNVNSGSNLTIGMANGDGVGDMQLDNFAIWSREISASEVAAMHARPTRLA